MARSNKKITKAKIKSRITKIGKLAWGQRNKNANTIKKIEKANYEDDMC